ncbi:RNA binding (RRM/RBD/RNP motifs) family protein [Euphorbia peplus]|nr:RNA binding (RRM/RBD/RNP motifs) family protein [Euphorbia peplus]
MSDKGDKLCPLCTEEMDLTDQQLKPCSCGYEICVWCWNHIMEMADMDNSKGRCPACRSPYDKEKIVGMAANCERLVAEVNSERKLKSHKVKPKLSDGKMHLTNVRVIQRNLVYIIGLPLNLADEALLQRREFFGQYGKVLKVSISKTATGAIQHSANNSCCVYITYLKEEEAVRCIQSVHSFVLEGRSLRACFGTTKYCHAWLKNLPCSIPDCLYLHEFGSQEDSFTKDDLVSAFTRSRIQQTIGATNNSHRSGTVLPPPADEYSDRSMSSMTRLDCNTPLNNTADNDKGSHVDNDPEGSNSNPGVASWVTRISSSVPLAKSLSGFDGTLGHKAETTIPSEDGSMKISNNNSCEVDPNPVTSGGITVPAVANPPPSTNLCEDTDFQGLCSAISSVSFANHLVEENAHNPSASRGLQQDANFLQIEPSASSAPRESSNVQNFSSFVDLGLKSSGDIHSLPSASRVRSSRQNLNLSGYASWHEGEVNQESNISPHRSTAPTKNDDTSFPLRPHKPELSSGFFDNPSGGHLEMQMGLEKYSKGGSDSKVAPDIGESRIISSILSMDMDTWEDTLTSQGLFKFLDDTDNEHGSLKMPSRRKSQESSRFSFARQDDLFNQDPNLGHSLPNGMNYSAASNHYYENKDLCMAKYNDISSYGRSVNSFDSVSSHPYPTSKYSVPASPPGFSLPSRVVPPGFPTNGAINYDANHLMQNSVPSSMNFGSSVDFDFVDPAIMEVGSGMLAARLKNSSFDTRPAMTSLGNPLNHDTQFQMLMQQPISVKQNHRFQDHFRNRFSPQNDAYGISSMLVGESPPNNSSPFSQVTAQHVRNLNVPGSCWVGWDEMKSGNNLGMSELLVNGRAGFSKYVPSPEEIKYQMSGSSNLYNRGFAL